MRKSSKDPFDYKNHIDGFFFNDGKGRLCFYDGAAGKSYTLLGTDAKSKYFKDAVKEFDDPGEHLVGGRIFCKKDSTYPGGRIYVAENLAYPGSEAGLGRMKVGDMKKTSSDPYGMKQPGRKSTSTKSTSTAKKAGKTPAKK